MLTAEMDAPVAANGHAAEIDILRISAVYGTPSRDYAGYAMQGQRWECERCTGRLSRDTLPWPWKY
jgi:hypothetical protein